MIGVVVMVLFILVFPIVLVQTVAGAMSLLKGKVFKIFLFCICLTLSVPIIKAIGQLLGLR